jgi:hypothetical protein
MIPVILFHYCRERNIPLNVKNLLEVCKTTEVGFRRGRIAYLRECSDYFTRDRVSLIKNFILMIQNKFDLDNAFYENALHLAQYFWKYIHHTTDTVIAGLVSSLAVLCDYESYREKVTINEICKVVNIQASTVNSRISKTVVKQLHIDEFESPVKSHGLLKTYIHKFEIIPTKEARIQPAEEIEAYGEPLEATWVGFEDALAVMMVEVSQHYGSIPSHTVHIEVPNQEVQEPELHIFQFPSTEKGQSKGFAVQLMPISQGIKKSQDNFVFTAQKGPPWKDMPLVHPG